MDTKNISWPEWETVKLIGRGSFGAVYEIQRDVLGDVEKAALKVISIPQHESDIDEMYSDGYDDESITSTFQSHLKSIVAEYSLMKKMNDSLNVVHSDDIRYIQHENGFGWDIFIKMELLTPLTKALPADIPEETVLQLAKDMCTALELCRKHGVVHRDIKPQNIFLSPNGNYKLGDFGIAKTVEKTMGGTKIGTYKYMAPEVYNNQPYGMGADIYSLGLVLYWMLNERRMPFLPLPPEKLSSGMEERARNRRFSGEPLPPPAHGSADLKKIVLKACAFDPKERYSSAAEMLHDLNEGFGSEAVRRRKEEEQRRKEQEEQERLRKEREEQERIRKEREEQERIRKEREEQERLRKEREEQEQRNKKKEDFPIENKTKSNRMWIIATAVIAICAIGSVFVLVGWRNRKMQFLDRMGMWERNTAPVENQQMDTLVDRNITIVTVGELTTGILEKAAELMEQENYTLTIVDLSDYDKPNFMVENGEADANLFQHETYMTAFNDQHGTHLVGVTPVFYSSDAGEEYSITLAVKVGNESSKKIQTLICVLQSEEIARYINANCDGFVSCWGAAEKATSEETLKSAEVGDYVLFGKYEQDNNTFNGAEDIEWLVLDKEDGKILVISKYVLDWQKYDASDDCTWETCTLRQWLNDDFLNAAFSSDEKKMIPTVTVNVHREEELEYYHSYALGSATQDKVFLLSGTEAREYFGPEGSCCRPTMYARSKGAFASTGAASTWWWLRSAYTEGHAPCVSYYGDIDNFGKTTNNYGVRPAMWIELEN